MRRYRVNSIEYIVYDPEDTLPGRIIVVDWRDGHIGDWVKADDGCVLQVLRRGKMLARKGKSRKKEYIGTCTGTFPIAANVEMDTQRRANIYSFGGNKSSEDILIDRQSLNERERLFVLHLTHMSMQDAYTKAFPTNNKRYALERAQKLVKTERVQTAMKEELKPILKELGISERTILRNIHTIACSAEKDETKLKALFKLADVMDLEDKNTTSITQISAAKFTGFLDDDLDKAVRPTEIEEK